MTRKPLDHNEFISALDFVKTDIDNLRAYFEHGAIQPTLQIMERALKLRVSIEMFVALFPSSSQTPLQNEVNFSTATRELILQSQILAKQNAEVLEELKKSKEPIQSTILNEVLNVKEMLLRQEMSEKGCAGNEIEQLKYQLSSSLTNLERRMVAEISQVQKPSSQNGVSLEILSEMAEFREECAKQIAGVEKNIIENIEASKDDIIYAQKSDEILKVIKDNSADTSKSIVLAKTSMQVLRGISKQLLGVYEAQKRALADIEKAIAGVSYQGRIAGGEDKALAEGFAELKEELQSISNIINFDELDKIQDTNQAIEIADSIANQAFEPEGLLQTAKELEALATELSELEKSQAEREVERKSQEENYLKELDEFEEETDELEKIDGEIETDDETANK